MNTSVVDLALSQITGADSPRRGPIDEAHARLLAESLDKCPPVVINRSTMRVIDGAHRVRAAQLLGWTTVSAQFFEGTDSEAFAVAVQLNVTHGLPLALADRKMAAARLLVEHPGWSDRAIAAVSGVSDKTVAAVRRGAGAEVPQPTTRLARNGVSYPVDRRAGRRRVVELLETEPEMSLTELARSSGVSLTTVKDVRKRLRLGQNPELGESAGNAPAGHGPVAGSSGHPVNEAALLERLRRDPSVRFNQSGRTFLRWLETPIDWDSISPSIPPHCATIFAELARKRADDLRRAAAHLESHSATIDDAGEETSAG